MRVFQILTTVSYGDAVSNDCLALYSLLKTSGYETYVYAENIGKQAEKMGVKPYARLPRLKDDDIILYHLSTGTELNERIKSLSGKKYIVYHNTTPPDVFVPYSGKLARLCSCGLEETKSLKDTFDGGLCDSDFNRQQLISYGYKCPLKVRPILIPFEDYRKEPDKETLEQMGGDARENEHEIKNVLFVGRIAPNKCQEDLISLLYAYRKMYSDPIRLVLAGNPSGLEKYMSKLRAYADELGLDDIVFTGQISFAKILAYYRSADAFVSMSEHEGFCVPLVEAMFFDVPILAFASTAVPETLGGCGIIFDKKDPSYAAKCLHAILNDNELKSRIVEEQRERLKYFEYENVSKIFVEQFREFTGR
ncbi:Glycosyltransferase involved in cell wall bisynthesis [Ruminococcaceae bacterium KH2T8]|nr:Glycosyltransferase involved in cell wall bisynthesis [Ruminococcaceae bacterium KH2T8]